MAGTSNVLMKKAADDDSDEEGLGGIQNMDDDDIDGLGRGPLSKEQKLTPARR